jgi:hypothetical protein
MGSHQGVNRMDVTWRARRPHVSVDQEASRLVAIRAIVDLADDDEEIHDVVAEALLVLGASRAELTAAMLGTGPA